MQIFSLGKLLKISLATVLLPEPVPPAIPIRIGFFISITP
jgi:hypothetical protein